MTKGQPERVVEGSCSKSKRTPLRRDETGPHPHSPVVTRPDVRVDVEKVHTE